ncbi:protein PML-like isoform X3 [Alligator mississippiensis]|uniref:protein PML-like isoform X3 n=1 Tax=Alligator mississippiensis TaxID=8496 RepID=UPI0028772ABE|nr:protein PML-like isoform X3 [Alligator mississippiensis]
MDATSQEPPADQDSSTPVVEEEFQFLLCDGCRNESRELKLLSCLHTLCIDCLQENKPIDQCPICRVPILQPGGIPNQDNLLYTSLQSQMKTYQKIVMGIGLGCGNCKTEGEFWCSDCEEFMCLTCFKLHQKFLKLESHEARNVKELQAGSLREFLEGVRKPCNLFCTTHKTQIACIYCSICCKPKCLICALLDSEHRGQCCDIKAEILRRQEELWSMTEELKQKKSHYESACNNLHDKEKQLNQVWKETRELILKKVEEMVKLIQEKGEELLKRAERQHHEEHQDLKGKMQHLRAMFMRMEAAEQLVEKMHLYASDQVVMDMHPFIKRSLVELQKQPPLTMASDVQIGDFSECKTQLEALVEQVMGDHGPSTESQQDGNTLVFSLECLYAPESPPQHTHLPVDSNEEGLLAPQDTSHHLLSPAMLPTSGTRDIGGDADPEVSPMSSPEISNEAHFSSSITKRKGGQDTEIPSSPAKFIKTEADDGKWEKWAREPNLEQPGTSSSTGNGSGWMANSAGAVKEADLTEPLENNIPQEVTLISILESSEEDDSDEESMSSSLPDDTSNISYKSHEGDLPVILDDLLPEEFDTRQGSLLFFDLKLLRKIPGAGSEITQLAVIDGSKKFIILIQPLKSLPDMIEKGLIYETGMKPFFSHLRTVHKPILVGFALWSLSFPILFKALDTLGMGREFRETVFGFLDVLPLIKEKIPKAGSYHLKHLASNYLWKQLNELSALEAAEAVKDLCTVLEIDPVQEPRSVLSYSSLECYASLQPLIKEKLLTKPSSQTLARHNISLSVLSSVYRKDPVRGLQNLCRFLNYRWQNAGKIRNLSKIRVYFQRQDQSAGHQETTAPVKCEQDN